jgi:hypothetical protein
MVRKAVGWFTKKTSEREIQIRYIRDVPSQIQPLAALVVENKANKRFAYIHEARYTVVTSWCDKDNEANERHAWPLVRELNCDC